MKIEELKQAVKKQMDNCSKRDSVCMGCPFSDEWEDCALMEDLPRRMGDPRMTQDKFYVTRDGRRWVVHYPNGKVRCSVTDPTFAYTVCRELNEEIGATKPIRKNKRPCGGAAKKKPVRCFDTGEVFESGVEAGTKMGVHPHTVSCDCLGKVKKTNLKRPRFEFAEVTV